MHPFPELTSSAEFWIVRHGESEGNNQRIIQGRSDFPLSQTGKKQARETGLWLRDHAAIKHICASPLSRANETASIIAEQCKINPEHFETRKDLQELDTGTFTKRRFDDIQREDAASYHEFQARSWDAVPEAESRESLRKRAIAHWSYLVGLANAGNASILSVTHVGFLQWLYKTTLSTDWDTWMPFIFTANCGIFHLVVHPRPSTLGPQWFMEWKLLNHVVWRRSN